MKHLYSSTTRKLSASYGKFFLLIFLLGTTAFLPMKIMNYGISNPSAIAVYLNNNFPDEAPSSSSSWTAEVAFPNLTFTDPIQLLELPGTNKFIMAGKKGRLWTFDKTPSTNTKTTVLNIEAKILTSGDAGLMGMAIHPEFGQSGSPNRGYIYIWSRQKGPTNNGNLGYVVLSRYNWPDGASTLDANSEFIMIKQYDRHQWHNGGGMFFGMDGFLYISSGDEGGANDQYNTGQKINVGLLAGALRIDVDKDPSRSHAIRRQPLNPATPPSGWPNSFSQGYFVPNDNPWQDVNGTILEEFYAIGFRSPHRMTQDTQTGDIWMGDVGQGSREEVSLVPKGSNLQWPYKEGLINGPKSKPGSLIGFDQPPVHDYARGEGTCVIGGFVYRGNKWPSLRGKYIFGDHTTRRVWALDHNQQNGNTTKSDLVTIPAFGTGSKAGISAFATDAAGEIYVLKLYGTNQDGGRIYKLNASNITPEPPQFLSQTGAFSDLTDLTPAAGVIPYKVNAPLWSDGSAKKRWVAIPNNGTYNTAAEDVVWAENSEWQFPEGTVFIKHFEMPLNENDPSIVKRLETRFMVRDKNGGLYGVTYKWNSAGTDAELLPGADTEPYSIAKSDGSTFNGVWEFPSRADCMTCHNENAGGVLGVNTHQLNGEFEYPSGVSDNQIRTWNHLGIFDINLNEPDIPGYIHTGNINDPNFSLEERVRSYLDGNCAHCHQPNGVNANFDAQFTTPLGSQSLINGALQGSYGIPDAAVVKPGETGKSILYIRDNSIGNDAMPPLAKSIVDDEYIEVLAAWIGDLDPNACQGTATTFLSDLNWVGTPTNGWGPVEKDITNGGTGSGDGGPLTINGKTYQKGLGTHANAEVIYNLGGAYNTLLSDIGVDDGTCNAGSVGFEVYTDGTLAYSSPTMTQADDAISISIDVTGVNQLRLVVSDGGNGITCDHADWGNIRLETVCADNQPPVTVFSAFPISGDGPLTVSFDASATSDPENDPITSYSWDFGDGNSGTGPNPSHIYGVQGTFRATLTTTDNQGNSSINFVNINVGPVSIFPVEMVSFTASAFGEAISLSWQTALEQNNEGFEIQRFNEINERFEKIAWVQGKGDTNDGHSYLFFDTEVRPGKLYTYRLRQVDLDGQFTYSDQVSAQLDGAGLSELKVYPNPLDQEVLHMELLGVEIKETVFISMFDNTGRLIIEQQLTKEEAENRVSLEVGNLPGGIYSLRVSSSSFSKVRKIIVR
ncbi:MAG: NPCBM/NEW2 domain-containing protein [Bacteroidota bacterium]